MAPLLARMAICAGLAAWLACHVPRRGTGAGDRAGGAELAGGAAGAVMVLSLVLTIVAARPGRLPIPAVVLTELHVLAAAGWVGGLAALAVAMVPRRDPAVLNATLGSFSWLSMACVTTLAVTGTIHAWLHAGGLTPLVSSPYGAALAAKLLAVVGMLGAATGSHTYVRRLRATPAPVQVVALFIGAELALGVAAMALTADLVAVAD